MAGGRGVGGAFTGQLPKIKAALQHLADAILAELLGLARPHPVGAIAALIERLGDVAVAVPRRRQREGQSQAVDRVGVGARDAIVAFHHAPRDVPVVEPLRLALGLTFGGLLAQVVRIIHGESREHREHHPAHRRGEVELSLDDRDEGDTAFVQPRQRVEGDTYVPGEAIQLMDHDHVEPPRLGIL